MNEDWRGLEGWPYEVSSHGRVRRGDRIVKPTANPNGYLCVNMTAGGRRSRCAIHGLVLTAFVGPRGDGQVGNHKDGVKSNNALTNLEWTTHAGNMAHSAANGLHARGSRQHLSKLTQDQVVKIAAALRSDNRRGVASRLAREFGVTPEAISSIRRGLSWAHVTGFGKEAV